MIKKGKILNKETIAAFNEDLNKAKRFKNVDEIFGKKKTQKEILLDNADAVIDMLENDFNYRQIAKKFLVDLSVVNDFVNNSQHSARARQAISNSADTAFDKAEDAILDISDDATQAAVARQRELAHHYRRKAAVKNKNKFSENHRVQAEIKDTSATSSWLGEVLSEIDKNK